MPLIAAGVGAGIGGISSIIGGAQAAKESAAARKQAADFTNKAIAVIEKLGIPTVEAQKIALENPQLVFQYAPELEKEFPEIKSKLESIQTDPRLKEYVAAGMAELQQKIEGGGFTPEELAQINDLKRGVAQQANARDASLQMQMQQRGLGGSGQELMSRMLASQSAAQQQSVDSDNLARQAYTQKLAAIQQLADTAGQAQSREFGQQAQVASAGDEATKYITNLNAQVQSTNVAQRNAAARSRAELQQDLENQRVATANAEQQYNKQLQQQQYENQLQKAGLATSAYTGAATGALQAGATAAANKQQMWSGIGNAAMGGAQLYGAASKGSGASPTVAARTKQPWEEEGQIGG